MKMWLHAELLNLVVAEESLRKRMSQKQQQQQQQISKHISIFWQSQLQHGDPPSLTPPPPPPHPQPDLFLDFTLHIKLVIFIYLFHKETQRLPWTPLAVTFGKQGDSFVQTCCRLLLIYASRSPKPVTTTKKKKCTWQLPELRSF